MNKLYTAQEIADRLKIKKTTVYELIKRGELESSKIGKQLRISEEQLNRYLQGTHNEPSVSSIPFPEFQPESSLLKRDYLLYSKGLIISGQASPALEYLINQLSVHPAGLPVMHTHLNTYNGLYSLYFKKVHAAAADLVREYMPTLLPQTAANREKGSSSRICLDLLLKEASINPEKINSSQKELVSDLSTANAVLSGQADTALGAESIVFKSKDLDFVPIRKLPMFLVMESASLKRPGFTALTAIICSDEFQTAIRLQNGCDASRTGEVLYL